MTRSRAFFAIEHAQQSQRFGRLWWSHLEAAACCYEWWVQIELHRLAQLSIIEGDLDSDGVRTRKSKENFMSAGGDKNFYSSASDDKTNTI